MQDGPKAIWSIPHVSVAFFPSLKQNFIAYRSSKVLDCIFEIHQLWQSGFSRVYSNCCYRGSFEAEIIKIGQSSHKMYSNNILNFKCPYEKSLETYRMHLVYIYIYIYIYICTLDDWWASSILIVCIYSMSRTWQKVAFKWSTAQSFPSRLLVQPSLRSPVFPTWWRIDRFMSFPKALAWSEKRKQPCPRFELGSPIPFSVTIVVTSNPFQL